MNPLQSYLCTAGLSVLMLICGVLQAWSANAIALCVLSPWVGYVLARARP